MVSQRAENSEESEGVARKTGRPALLATVARCNEGVSNLY
jgi:hypothetical protein